MIDLEIPSFLRHIFILAVIIVSIVGLKFSAPIIGPIILSIFLSILIYPFLIWLKKRGLSYNLSLVITIIGAFALGGLILIFLFYTLNELVTQIPELSINSSTLFAQLPN
jgi:AI-2 transport protein TqsA